MYGLGHGEFNLHLLNALKMETPDYNDLYETSYNNFRLDEVDVNGDVITSIEEAKNWISDFDSRQALQPSGHYDDPQWSDDGEIGEFTSLDYPTIYHNSMIQSELTIKGISCISGYFYTGGSTDYDITLQEGSELYLINDADVWISHNSWFGASLIIEDNCKIYGEDDAIINLQGFMEVGENVEFNSLSGGLWEGLQITGDFVDERIEFNNANFNNFKITSDQREINLSHCYFENSSIKFINENFSY
ncbi:MAG: hypothetical protein DRI23_13470, partial [Candidatus Cloacimonadota bacterium]